MFYQGVSGRFLGLFVIAALSVSGALLLIGTAYAGSSQAEVAVEHKQEDLANFQLAEFRTELLQCSALSAIHMWIGDNLADEGAQVRQQLDEEYWLNTSKDYLALANRAGGGTDLTEAVGAEIKILTADWRHLTEEQATADEWLEWYELTERCDSWRADPPRRQYLNNPGQSAAANLSPQKSVTSDAVAAGVMPGPG